MMHNTATVTGLSHDGRGIAILDGKTTFIAGALTHETVLFQITKKHRRYNEGTVIEVLSPSSLRTLPQCRHVAICGGCSLQHLQLLSQLQFKQDVVIEQLKHFGNVTPEIILPPLSGNPYGYRRKARLGVRYVRKKGRLLIGFREKFSNYLADIQQCEVLHPSVGQRLPLLTELISGLTQYEHIPQIEVAVGDANTALVFRHLTPLPPEDISKLTEFGKQHDFHIYLQPHSPTSLQKLWPEDNHHLLHYSLPEFDLKMEFHPLDFTQVNAEMNQLLIQQALTLLSVNPSDRVLDLFCGLGNFSLPLAKQAHYVTGIEGSSEMVARAKMNAENNQIHNADFEVANLMAESFSAPWALQTYDKILIDPPRTGAKEIIPLLSHLGSKTLVYVSCNPATFARDAGELVNTYQYRLKKIGIINMFPHTSHVETITLFQK